MAKQTRIGAPAPYLSTTTPIGGLDPVPDSSEFETLRRRVAKLLPEIVPHSKDVTEETVFSGLRSRGVKITKPVFDEIVRSAEPAAGGLLSLGGGVWIVPQLGPQRRTRYAFRR